MLQQAFAFLASYWMWLVVAVAVVGGPYLVARRRRRGLEIVSIFNNPAPPQRR